MSGGRIPFTKQMDFEYTEVQQVTPLVRRVVARNPSGFTFYGTNTYIIGHGRVAIIDPGPLMKEHIGALRSALKEEIVEHILVTHTHHDHSPGVVPLREKVGGCIWGKLPKPIGEKSSTAESIDWSFSPDQELKDGTQVSGEGWTLEAIHTPGHMSNHMCFALAEERILFTGDHIMAWNTTLVSPPDGNMGDYFKSLEVCLSRDETVYWPAHGPEIINPKPFTRAYRNHRRMREGEIIRCLDRGLHKVTEIVEALYSHLPEKMHKAAGQSVLAHLEHMIETGRVKHYKNIGSEGHYENL